MKTFKYLLLSFLIVNHLNAQTNESNDTIALARSTAYQKDFVKADQLLTKYNADHTDINGLSLHAQVLYWMRSFDRSIETYEKAIALFPQPSSLYLDYARVLFSLGKLSKTQKLLKTYRQFDTANAEADIMNAYITLWNGRLKLAGKKADQLLQKYPGNSEAKDIISKIDEYSVPYSKIGTQYFSDDQPLKGSTYYAEAGVYKSWLFAPTAQAAVYQYKAGDSSFHSSWIQLGNAIQLGTKTRLKLKGGFFQQSNNESALTGSAEISQQISHNFSLRAALDRRPYQFTISSIKRAVMENVSSVSLDYNRKDKWFGKAGYDMYQYEDGNKINVAYLWILAPIVSTKHFSFSAGYAFRYADALNSTITSKQSIPEVINNWPPVNGIPGYYDPYFTPANQMAHSALASIKISPSRRVRFTSSVNIAFSAKADNPYLYLDTHDSGLVFNKGFAQVSYTPISWVNELTIATSDRFSIAANYSYDKLLYYTCNKGSLELKYLFLR